MQRPISSPYHPGPIDCSTLHNILLTEVFDCQGGIVAKWSEHSPFLQVLKAPGIKHSLCVRHFSKTLCSSISKWVGYWYLVLCGAGERWKARGVAPHLSSMVGITSWLSSSHFPDGRCWLWKQPLSTSQTRSGEGRGGISHLHWKPTARSGLESVVLCFEPTLLI